MSESDAAIEDTPPPPPPSPKTKIRYSTDSYNRCKHTKFDLAAVKPGDIGSLYAAISDAITTDLNRLRIERRAASKTRSVGTSGSMSSEQLLDPLNCDIKIDLCRLLNKDLKLILPPLEKATFVEFQDDPHKRMDFLDFLLKDGAGVGGSGEEWGEQISEGLCFKEGDAWPWYCLRVSYAHESRLDKVLKYHSRISEAGVDPQTFFPPPPPPPPSPPPAPAVAADAKAKSKQPPAAPAGAAARTKKMEVPRGKSRGTFNMKSLIGGGS